MSTARPAGGRDWGAFARMARCVMRFSSAIAVCWGCGRATGTTDAQTDGILKDVDATDGFGACPADKPVPGGACTNMPNCLYDWVCAPCCGYTSVFACQNGKWSGEGIEELPGCDVGPATPDVADAAVADAPEADVPAAADASADVSDVALADASSSTCGWVEEHGSCVKVTPSCSSGKDCDSGACGANGHCNEWTSICLCASDADCGPVGTNYKSVCVSDNVMCGVCLLAQLCKSAGDCAPGAYCTVAGICQSKCCP